MEQNLTARSFIVRVYRVDTEDTYKITGLVGGSVTGGSYVGGLVGKGDSVIYSYWDTETSGQSSSDGGTGLTTAQMKQSANFSGWDFTGVWRIYDGYSYPLLKSFLTPLTITANDAASRTYDATAYSGGNGVAYAGFVGGETAAVLSGALSYAGNSQGAVNAGTYVIKPGGLASGNNIRQKRHSRESGNPLLLKDAGSGAPYLIRGPA